MCPITAFIDAQIVFDAKSSESMDNIRNAYIEFNNGSTTGKIKVINAIAEHSGVSKQKINGKQVLYGVALTSMDATPVKETVKDELTEFERLMLIEKQKDREQQAAIEQAKLNLKLKIKREEAERQATIEQQKIERLATIEQQKIERLATIEQQKIEQQASIKQQKIEQQASFKQRDETFLSSIEQAKIDVKREKMEVYKFVEQEKVKLQVELKRMDIEQQEKNRAFMQQENNKNRKMFLMTRFNKYLDVQVYGTPSAQYITSNSMEDVLGFNMFDKTGVVKQTDFIKQLITDEEETIDIVENNHTNEVSAINVKRVSSIVDAVYEQEHIRLDNISTTVDTIETIARSDDVRHLPSRYVTKKSMQQPDKYKTMQTKDKYLRASNDAKMDGDKLVIKCYTCSTILELNSGSCHRSHDIPRSDGGDCSIDNIYLCCANCNQHMGDDNSVFDHKVELYMKLIDGDNSRTRENLNQSNIHEEANETNPDKDNQVNHLIDITGYDST